MMEKNTDVDLSLYLSGVTKISVQDIIQFFRFIGAPPRPVGLLEISKNLGSVLPVLKVVKTLSGADFSSKIRLEVFQDLCDWINENHDQLRQRFPWVRVNDSKIRQVFKGYSENWPLYLSLFNRHPISERRAIHKHLLAHLLISQEQFRQYSHFEEKDYRSTTIESTRFVRLSASEFKGARGEERQKFLKMLPEEPLSQKDLLEYIDYLPEDDRFDPNLHKPYHDVLRRMLSYAISRKGGFGRSKNGDHRRFFRRKRQIISISDPVTGNEIIPGASPKLIRMPSIDEEEESEAIAVGCVPEEAYSRIEHFVLDSSTEPQSKKALSSDFLFTKVRTTRKAYVAVAMNNQLLSNRWNLLSIAEICVLLTSISDLVRQKSGQRRCDYHPLVSNAELAALLTAVFWTGNTLCTVLRFRFADNEEDIPQKVKEGEHRYLLRNDEWIVGVPKPQNSTRLSMESKRCLVSPADYIRLHNRSSSGVMLKVWWRIKSEVLKRELKPNEHMFSQNEEDYTDAIKFFLQQINREYKYRITLIRISNVLPSYIYQECGDWTDVVMLTGRRHYLAETPLHYSAPTVSYLQQLYENTCLHITNQVYLESGKEKLSLEPNPYWEQFNEKSPARTGCRHLPQRGMIDKLVNDLKARFSKSTQLAGLPDYLVELHNDYTLYVVQFLSFCSGYKAVRSPLSSIDQVDEDTGLAIISDKDDEHYYHSRLVWLPKMLFEQLHCYAAHTAVIAQRLALVNSDLSKIFLSKNELSFLFLLSNKYKFTYLSPKEIKERLHAIFPVPVNVNRTYLRNRLKEKGLSGEMIHYFLGHWENGQEPFGEFSTLSPSDYVNQLQGPLSEIINEDGWQMISGLACSE